MLVNLIQLYTSIMLRQYFTLLTHFNSMFNHAHYRVTYDYKPMQVSDTSREGKRAC